MLQRIRLLLMPDLSTSAKGLRGFCALFLLAARPVRDSFQSSDDRDAGSPKPKGWLQDQPDGNGQNRRGHRPVPGHGTQRFPRVEADPIGRKCSPSLRKSDCFGRGSDKMMKGFPGEAGPRKGADRTIAGSVRSRLRCFVVIADRKIGGAPWCGARCRNENG